MFHHSQINQKKSKSVKGMKDKDKEEEDVKGPVEMEIRKPWDVNPSDKGITGEDFQSDQDEKQRTAESNEIVRKHVISYEFGVGSSESQNEEPIFIPQSPIPASVQAGEFPVSKAKGGFLAERLQQKIKGIQNICKHDMGILNNP